MQKPTRIFIRRIEYRMIGNRIEVRTLNLDGDFDSIKAQLDGIAEKYFGIRTA